MVARSSTNAEVMVNMTWELLQLKAFASKVGVQGDRSYGTCLW